MVLPIDPVEYDPPTQMPQGWGWECGSSVCRMEWPPYGKLGLIIGGRCLNVCMYVCSLMKVSSVKVKRSEDGEEVRGRTL